MTADATSCRVPGRPFPLSKEHVTTTRYESDPAGSTAATFTIIDADHIAVSVVGSFND
jgi:hypothetical protein